MSLERLVCLIKESQLENIVNKGSWKNWSKKVKLSSLS